MTNEEKEIRVYRSAKNLDHDVDLAAAIGNMVVAWAFAEMALVQSLARISGLRANVALMAYHRIPTINSRMQFILALSEDWEAGEFNKAQIRSDIEGLAGLNETRNKLVHGNWVVDSAFCETAIFNYRASLKSGNRKMVVKINDVKNHNSAVLQRSDRLYIQVKADQIAI